MNGSSIVRRGLICTLAVLATLFVTAAGFIGAVDAGYFRGPFVGYISARVGRRIEVEKTLEVHLFSLHPRVIAADVTIGNPTWTPSGITAQIGKLSLTFDLPRFGHSFGVVDLGMEAATLYLMRDSRGYANWQWTDPDTTDETELPIIRSLSAPNVRVLLDDALRHLKFDGTVSARHLNAADGLPALRLEGTGQLNGRPASFEITSDPLITAAHDKAYHFSFVERSSGSRLSGRGFLLRPFDFDLLDTTFEAAGADLKDLYFLTGVTLINTGSYRLSGKLARRGAQSTLSDLDATSGQSDIRGTVSIESSKGRPKFDIDLYSQFLRLSDLGERAAGRASEPETKTPLFLSDATLSPSMVRRGDALVRYRAQRVEVSRVALQGVSAKATIDHGVLIVAPLLADVLGGKLTSHLRLDARTDIPAADVELNITDLQLGQIHHKGSAPPPLEGSLQVKVAVTGRGSSVHQVAATASGTVTAILPHGTIRSSLAELTGIDLRGLGLLVTKSAQEDTVRCAIADFKAQDGTLTAQRLVMDTDPVLITGDGTIHLDTETLDLVLRGHPKSLRLFRLRSPVLVRGTLSQPSVGIQARTSVLALVAAGRAKDVDCAALLAHSAE